MKCFCLRFSCRAYQTAALVRIYHKLLVVAWGALRYLSDDLEDSRVGIVEVGGEQLSYISMHPPYNTSDLPTFCCPSKDMLRMACHCMGCFACAIGRLHPRHVKAPKALDVDLKLDMMRERFE